MRYIANSSGYLLEVSFGADIACGGENCTQYTGSVPSGYASLEEWYIAEGDKLYRWKIVSGNLTLDSSATAPKDVVILRADGAELGISASGYGGYVDFHYSGSEEDYTSRIIETAAGLLALNQGGRVTLGTIANPTEVLRTLLNPTNFGYITDFNTGNGAVPGLWRVYNASGTDANAPYSGAVGGLCLVFVVYDSDGAVGRVYQLLLDSYGDVYYKVISAGVSYGTWKKLTN